jgi:hypothetical protein
MDSATIKEHKSTTPVEMREDFRALHGIDMAFSRSSSSDIKIPLIEFWNARANRQIARL